MGESVDRLTAEISSRNKQQDAKHRILIADYDTHSSPKSGRGRKNEQIRDAKYLKGMIILSITLLSGFIWKPDIFSTAADAPMERLGNELVAKESCLFALYFLLTTSKSGEIGTAKTNTLKKLLMFKTLMAFLRRKVLANYHS